VLKNRGGKNVKGKRRTVMIIDLNKKERDLLVTELEKSISPELRGIVASGMRMRKTDQDDLKKEDEVALKNVLEKLKMAA